MSMNSTIVIPALNPPEHLITYVDDLIRSGASKFLIVDDGSSVEKQYIFQNKKDQKIIWSSLI